MIKSKNWMKRVLVLCVCGVLTFLCCAFAVSKPVKASAAAEELPEAAEQNTEEGITPYFGGTDGVTLHFYNENGEEFGYIVKFSTYAENYVWPMSDRGHYEVALFYGNGPIGVFDPHVNWKATMTYMWPEGYAGPVIEESGVLINGTNTYSYKHLSYAKDHCTKPNGGKYTAWSAYAIKVDLTVTLVGGSTETATLFTTF